MQNADEFELINSWIFLSKEVTKGGIAGEKSSRARQMAQPGASKGWELEKWTKAGGFLSKSTPPKQMSNESIPLGSSDIRWEFSVRVNNDFELNGAARLCVSIERVARTMRSNSNQRSFTKDASFSRLSSQLNYNVIGLSSLYQNLSQHPLFCINNVVCLSMLLAVVCRREERLTLKSFIRRAGLQCDSSVIRTYPSLENIVRNRY